MKKILLFAVIALFSSNLYSQERLIFWQFTTTSQNSTGQEQTYTATSLHPALSGSLLTRGNGFSSPSGTLARAFAAAYNQAVVPAVGNIPANQADAEAANTYFEFEVSARVGFKLALSELRANIRRTGTGPNGYIWKYSIDGSPFADLGTAGTLIADHTLDEGTLVITDLSGISALQNVSGTSKVIFRLYGWGGTNLAGTLAFGRSTSTDYYPLAVHGTATSETGTLAGFDFAAENGQQESTNATTAHGNLTVSAVSRGPGLIPMSSTIVRSIASNIKDYETVTRANLDDAIAQGDYYQFTLSANSGYAVSLSSLDVTLRRSETGATQYQWRYSLDGNTFFNIGSSGNIQLYTLGLVQPKVNLSGISELQNIPTGTTATFRLYVWGTTAATGNISIGRYGASDVANSLAVGGTVDVVTPVKLTSFTAQPKGNTVQLNWSTASETNNSHFEVLRSDGEDFKIIGTVKGNGNSVVLNNYSYIDNQPLPGISYYKLRQVDYDGKTEDSETVPVKIDLNLQGLKASGSINRQNVSVQFSAEKAGQGKIFISDIAGRVLSVKEITLNAGYNHIDVPVNIRKEFYVVSVISEGKKSTVKFIAE